MSRVSRSLLSQPSGPHRAQRWGLRAKIVAWNVTALAVLLLLLGLVARFTIHTFLTHSVHSRLLEEVKFAPPFGSFGSNSHSPHGGPEPGPEPGPQYDGSHEGPRDRSNGGPTTNDRPPYSPGQSDGPGGGGSGRGPGGGPEGPPQDSNPAPQTNGSDAGNSRSDSTTTTEGVSSSQPNDSNLTAARHFYLDGKPFGTRPILDAHAFAIAKAGNETEQYTIIQIANEDVEVLTAPIVQRGQKVAIVQAGYPLKEMEQALVGMDTALLLLTPFGLICACITGAVLTKHVLRPVREAVRAAENIGVNQNGALSDRIPVLGNDEFSELASTINDLLGRLENTIQDQARLIEQQRRFTADASHELKSPLTVIRGMAGLALDDSVTGFTHREALAKIDRASESMANLVQDLLLLARSDNGQLACGRVELLVNDILERALSAVAPKEGVSVKVHIPDASLSVFGNESELVRVLVNILANAIRYTEPPGAVRVTALTSGEDVVLQIVDTGIGIASEHLPHIGERFYRVSSARARIDGGTGLGLSICRSILEAHGGTLAFDSTVGKGTTVTIRLPQPD